jgi:hypothetical protein
LVAVGVSWCRGSHTRTGGRREVARCEAARRGSACTEERGEIERDGTAAGRAAASHTHTCDQAKLSHPAFPHRADHLRDRRARTPGCPAAAAAAAFMLLLLLLLLPPPPLLLLMLLASTLLPPQLVLAEVVGRVRFRRVPRILPDHEPHAHPFRGGSGRVIIAAAPPIVASSSPATQPQRLAPGDRAGLAAAVASQCFLTRTDVT